MRRYLAIAILVLQVSVLLLGALPQGLYALYPSMFAAHCVNKARPEMRCKGKCQMRKATAAALGVATGHALREETPVRVEMPCTLPVDVVLAVAPPVRTVADRLSVRTASRQAPPDLPPPKSV